MSETQTRSRDAGRRFEEAAQVALEDALQRRLRYHLLRLTVVGLGRDEVPLIVDLARAAFADDDVSTQVEGIRNRAGASALATAIADVVAHAQPGDGVARRAPVLVGAVVGAYSAMIDAGGPGDPTDAAVLGAVGGGTAAAVGRFIQERVTEVGVDEYLRTDG